MRQAIELSRNSACGAPQQSWFAQLRRQLFGAATPGSAARLDLLSDHLLRDIGLKANTRANLMLKERNFLR